MSSSHKSGSGKSGKSSSGSGSDEFDLGTISKEIRNSEKELSKETSDSLDNKEGGNIFENTNGVEEGTEGMSELSGKEKLMTGSDVTGVLSIFHLKCLNCKHLCPSNTKGNLHTSCHYEFGNKGKGNPACPAGFVKIVVALPYERIAKKLFTAHIEGDSSELASLHNRLNREDPEEKKKVMSLYTRLLHEYYQTASD
jgi:hypothetical protein